MTDDQAVGTVQALGILAHAHPCELNVHVTLDGYAWGLWQWQKWTHVPIPF